MLAPHERSVAGHACSDEQDGPGPVASVRFGGGAHRRAKSVVVTSTTTDLSRIILDEMRVSMSASFWSVRLLVIRVHLPIRRDNNSQSLSRPKPEGSCSTDNSSRNTKFASGRSSIR